MATREALVDALNLVQAWELTGFIQYTQHGLLLTGPMREVYREFFKDMAKEAHDHMQEVGDKIVSLGGIPTVEPNDVQQETHLLAMLQADLELEQKALAAYMKAWEIAGEYGHKPTVFWLEERISEEQMHCDDLEKLTRTDSAASVAEGVRGTG